MFQDRTSQDQIRQERRERLQVFLTKSQEYKDLVEEIFSRIERNADMKLKTVNCDNRDIYVGKCIAMKEILEAVRYIKMMQFKRED